MKARAVLAAVVATAVLWPACGALAEDAPAASPRAFALVDHLGRQVTDRDFLGSFVLLFFGYSHCPDICPTELAVIADAIERLGAPGTRVQPLFITIDPARDTAEALAAYVGSFHPRLIGLTGSPAQIAAVAAGYRVGVHKVEPEGDGGPGADDYVIDHTAASYLIGPDGRVLGLFQHGTPAADIAAAIRPLLAGTRAD
ncbi:MAG TPA: SCO family protein [Alphaproteobacteria bacterium]